MSNTQKIIELNKKIRAKNIGNKISVILPVVFLIGIFGCCEKNVNQDDTKHDEGLIDSTLRLPERNADARNGSELIQLLAPLNLREREEIIYSEVISGNVPSFLRQLKPISLEIESNGFTWNLRYYVMPEYMALGSDEDYFLIPMTPIVAQDIADSLGLSIVTRKMVDDIWQHADMTIEPIPIPPSPKMVTIPVFAHHNEIIWSQRINKIEQFPLGSLVAGQKKDVVLSNRILDHQNNVVIYGWHQSNGQPIQPLYSGHANWYADYSHGIRFAHEKCLLNGEVRYLSDLLKDTELYHLLSDEDDPMLMTRYPVNKSSYP